MRRHNIVACTLFILSIFSFVLTAPVAVRGLREAYADAVDGGRPLKIGPGKRAEVEDEDPMKEQLAQAPQEPSSSLSSQYQGSSSTPNYASETHPNPSFSSGESKPPLLSTSGGTDNHGTQRTRLNWLNRKLRPRFNQNRPARLNRFHGPPRSR
jgi:hypothetical protein